MDWMVVGWWRTREREVLWGLVPESARCGCDKMIVCVFFVGVFATTQDTIGKPSVPRVVYVYYIIVRRITYVVYIRT